MDYLKLLLADRIRDRATEFRKQSRNTKRKELEAEGLSDEAVEISLVAWQAQTQDDEYLTLAYDELFVVTNFIDRLQLKREGSLP